MGYAEEEREREQIQPVVIGEFTGLKNTVSEKRLGPNELQRAQNVDIDDARQIFRRRGQTKVATGAFHSLWEGNDFTLVVKDGDLNIVYPDYSFKSLGVAVGLKRVAFEQIAETVYFSSLDVSGKIDTATETVEDWGAVDDTGTWVSPVVNPTATLNPINGKLLQAPPMAHDIAALNGRMYLANDKVLWATELYLYDYLEKARNWMPFEDPITALGAVSDGLYVGTTHGAYYLSGAFGQMRVDKISNAGVMRNSMVPVTAELVRPERNMSRKAVCFMTHDGLYAGLDSGVAYNMTETQVLFPTAAHAAAMFRKQDGVNQYVSVLDSAGTPTTAARIGDYVDAEIVRHS